MHSLTTLSRTFPTAIFHSAPSDGSAGATAVAGQVLPPTISTGAKGAPNAPPAAPAPSADPVSVEDTILGLLGDRSEDSELPDGGEEESGDRGQESDEQQPGEGEEDEQQQQQLTSEEEEAAWLAEQPADVQARFAAMKAKLPAAPEATEPKKPDAPKPDSKAMEEAKQKAAAAVRAAMDNPLADLDTADAVAARMEKAEQLREWALANWDGATVGEGDDAKQLSAADMRAIFSREDAILRKWGPARETAVRQTEASLAKVAELHPYLKDNNSRGYQMFEALKTAPGLAILRTQIADWPTFFADAIAGRLSRQQPAGAKPGAPKPKMPAPQTLSPSPTKPSPTPKPGVTPANPPPPPSNGGTGGPRKPGNPRAADAIKMVLSAGGSTESIAAFLQTVGD